MVEPQPSKLMVPVRSRSPAPMRKPPNAWGAFSLEGSQHGRDREESAEGRRRTRSPRSRSTPDSSPPSPNPESVQGDVVGHSRTRKPPTTSPSTATRPAAPPEPSPPRQPTVSRRIPTPNQSRATLLGTLGPENAQQRHPQPRPAPASQSGRDPRIEPRVHATRATKRNRQ